MKFQRPVQSHGEYAGCYVPALSTIRVVAQRMLDEDIGITGFNRLERHLANVAECWLFSSSDIAYAKATARAIVNAQIKNTPYVGITLDDVCQLWYMDMLAMFVSTHPNASKEAQYQFYHQRLLREMKTFMVTYKQDLIRHFLLSFTDATSHALIKAAGEMVMTIGESTTQHLG